MQPLLIFVPTKALNYVFIKITKVNVNNVLFYESVQIRIL